MRLTILLVIVFLTSGCATQPSEISATYVSPIKYSKYDCDQIGMEMDYVSKRTVELYQSLNKKADNDTTQMAVGMILFWPTLFFLEGGDGPEATEYANLKGEFKALHQVAIEKKCEMVLALQSPEEIIAAKELAKQTGPEAQAQADAMQAESDK